MALIKVEELTFAYLEPIFDKVSFVIDSNWKTGLIGRNGIGKSTLFRLLLGLESYQGRISSQVDFYHFPPTNVDPELSILEIFYNLTGEQEWKLLKELSLLNVDLNVVTRQFNTLSKGEQTKVLLAIMFTIDNGFLLIDEPTNHLDLAGRAKVAAYLKSKSGFLLISHDRDFLDNTIDHVLAITNTAVTVQVGNFSSWYDNKMRHEQFEMTQNERLKRDIKRLQQAAQRTKNWSFAIEKTKYKSEPGASVGDKGNIGRRAAKMMQRSKNLERRQNQAIADKKQLLRDVDEAETLLIQQLPFFRNQLLHLDKVSVTRHNSSTQNLVQGDTNQTQAGQSQILFKDLDLVINQGDRIAICGANGCGKSTLLQILLGQVAYEWDTSVSCVAGNGEVANTSTVTDTEISNAHTTITITDDHTTFSAATESPAVDPIVLKQNGSRPSRMEVSRLQVSGQLVLPEQLQISYIPQDTSGLSGDVTEFMVSNAVDHTLCKAILTKLGFKRELFAVPMQNYSEGQKKKVLVAISLAKPAHLFVWDEPLNYLDVISRIQLEEMLIASNATMIFVEHDRSFVEKVATQVINLVG